MVFVKARSSVDAATSTRRSRRWRAALAPRLVAELREEVMADFRASFAARLAAGLAEPAELWARRGERSEAVGHYCLRGGPLRRPMSQSIGIDPAVPVRLLEAAASPPSSARSGWPSSTTPACAATSATPPGWRSGRAPTSGCSRGPGHDRGGAPAGLHGLRRGGAGDRDARAGLRRPARCARAPHRRGRMAGSGLCLPRRDRARGAPPRHPVGSRPR